MLSFFLAVLETEQEKQQLTKIYEKYHELVEKIALHILVDQNDAEDAVQNTFMQIIRHFEKIPTISCKDLQFWIISIVKNEARMILRKRKKMVQLEDWYRFVDESGNISDYWELVQLFSKLPETYCAVLEMKMILGYTGKEIAQHLGLSETAVHTQISRGRTLLRDIVEKEGFHR